jgi:hypothetical protein
MQQANLQAQNVSRQNAGTVPIAPKPTDDDKLN